MDTARPPLRERTNKRVHMTVDAKVIVAVMQHATLVGEDNEAGQAAHTPSRCRTPFPLSPVRGTDPHACRA